MLELSAAFVRIDSSFIGCCKNNNYKRRLGFLLEEVRPCPDMPTVVLPHYLQKPEYFGHLYFSESRPYWSQKFYFWSGVCGCLKTFSACVALYVSACDRRIGSITTYYCCSLSSWGQYWLFSLLFIPWELVLVGYRCIARRRSATDQIRSLKVNVAEYVIIEQRCSSNFPKMEHDCSITPGTFCSTICLDGFYSSFRRRFLTICPLFGNTGLPYVSVQMQN